MEDFQQAEQASRRCCHHQYYRLERSRLLSPGLLQYSTTNRWVRELNLVLLRQQVDGLVSNQYDFALGVVVAAAAAVAVVAVVVAAAAVVVAAVAVAAAAVVVVVVAAAAAVAAVVALDASVQYVLCLVHVDPEPRVLGGLVQVVFATPSPASHALASLEFLSLSLYPCLYS